MLFTVPYLESAYPITPVEPLKLRLRVNSEIFDFLVVNNNKYLYMLLTASYLESAYPITPVEPLKARFWDNFEICLLFSRKQQQIFITCC